ncbi:MAG: sulfur carrier protein ThiS [Alistipes sp.]|nr:sulfur carrier protein ThiS [Alistipes sp.]MDE6624133.1 sulfur carrier protein ThiS [Alistipes sp.]
MQIFINRTPRDVDERTTLAQMLTREGIPADGVAVAVDNRVVSRSEWAQTPLHEGARIIVIRAVCGG